MAWRVRGAGNEIEERHVTEVQPGGQLRHDEIHAVSAAEVSA
jgi:hypothetical protein